MFEKIQVNHDILFDRNFEKRQQIMGMKKSPTLLIDRLFLDTKIFTEWLNHFEIKVEKEKMLAGPSISPDYPVWVRYHDNLHYPMGMRRLLELGFTGIRDIALQNANKMEGKQKRYLLLIHETYKEALHLIARFAMVAKNTGCEEIYKVCDALTKGAPQTFHEACQAYWFATLFRIGTHNIGRIDQALYPFYKRDLEKGLIDEAKAKKILREMVDRWEERGNNKADTLQNITLSGRTDKGEDCTNAITYFLLELCNEQIYLEPEVNIRLHKNSPQKLLDLMSSLQMKGSGICTVFNDDLIIEGLKDYGRPPEIAEDYCADGCSEIILDGHGETIFRYVDSIKAVEHVLFNGEENVPEAKAFAYFDKHQEAYAAIAPVAKGMATGDFLQMETWEEFYAAYLQQLQYQTRVMLDPPFSSDEGPMRAFVAATMPGVLETGIEPYTNPACYHTYGLFTGSLGTAVNSLAAVKWLVYDKQMVSREELQKALRANFEGYETLRGMCKAAPKFGNDDDYVDQLAVDISHRFAGWVKQYKDRTGKPILPGLYNHMFCHTAHSVGATPDGRRFGDSVGEHFSPTPGSAGKGPTSIINSVCKVDGREYVFGNTLHLSVLKASLKGLKDPQAIIRDLIRGFCAKGGGVVNLSVLDVKVLLEAKERPEDFQDLIVRVWGFSHYFVHLSKEMQEQVISRYGG